MAVATSSTKSFVINGERFSHYHARDAHGTVLDNWWLNGKLVTHGQFHAALVAVTADCSSYLLTALGAYKNYTPNWRS